MASLAYFLVFSGFLIAITQSVTTESSNEWGVERSSLNPLSYTEEDHYSRDGATISPMLRLYKKRRTCPAGEHFTPCDANCEVTCDNYNKPLPCPRLCVWGCLCNLGLVRGPDKKCIKPIECPKKPRAEAEQNFMTDIKDTQSEETENPPDSQKETPSASQTNQFPLFCGKNEIFSLCPSTCPDDCNNFRNVDRKCRKSCMPIPSCVCKSGFVRSPDGKCIKPHECPKEKNFCPRGEEYSPCHSHCEGNCITGEENKNCQKGSRLCVSGCTCKAGLVRGPEGTCIYSTECPTTPPKEPPTKVCPENEVYEECKAACQRNCSNIHSALPCPRMCQSGCICKESMIRGIYGKCVDADECPKDGYSSDDDNHVSESVTEIPPISETENLKPSDKCPPRQRWIPCGAHCQRNCSNKDDIFFHCRPVCIPGCICEKGLVKGPDGECIEEDKCPETSDSEKDSYVTLNPPPYTDDDYHIPESVTEIPPISETENSQSGEIPPTSHSKPSDKCPPRQRWIPCGAHCQRNCSNKDDIFFHCRPVCIPGCICEKGLVKGPDGECIEEDKCPETSDSEKDSYVTLNPPTYTDDDYHIPESVTEIPPISETENSQSGEIPPASHSNQMFCGKDEIRELCPSTCPDNCKNYKDTKRKCGRICIPACVCKKGLVRGPKGKCIKPTECPGDDKDTCRKDEMFSKCQGNCEKNCSNWAFDLNCPKTCVSGCVCRPGRIRGPDRKCIIWSECPRNSRRYSDGPSTEDLYKYILSENNRLNVSDNAGCPNDNECSISCRNYGHRYGHCIGRNSLVCSCYIENYENDEYGSVEDGILPADYIV